MIGSNRLRHLSLPLCFALSMSTAAWGEEQLLPDPALPPAMEFDAESPQGTGVLEPLSEEAPLVPPLPESIELTPIEASKQQNVASKAMPADQEPGPIMADGQPLPPPRQLSPVEPEKAIPAEKTARAPMRPTRTRITDPLAELNAQQEAIGRQQQGAEVIEVAPHSVMLPGDSDLQPIEDPRFATVDPSTIEVVRQRYPDGSVKLAYEVGRDDEDNYVKHGDWKLLNIEGKVIAQGEYRNNMRHGMWRRWHNGAESALFLQSPYSQFTPPFYSEAEFKHDELDGTWSITDSQQRTVSELHFRGGLRHGKATWWHATGNLMQEIDFVDGEIHGELNVWNGEGQQLANHIYKHGRRDAPQVIKYANGQKKAEGAILEARTYITEPDDWWNAKTAVFTKEGTDEKHGLWRQWHPNGTLHVEGTYQHHVKSGKFTWWYATGQKALVGQYRDGNRHGQWCWWHANGQKQSEGTFAADEAIATWIWWNEDGTLERKTEASEGNPASRTAEGKSDQIKPTSFHEPVKASAEPQLLPVPESVR